jgi:hypothetical protein
MYFYVYHGEDPAMVKIPPGSATPRLLNLMGYIGQYLRHLQKAERGLRNVHSAYAGDLVENLA